MSVSVIDRIMELEAEKQKLIETAKREALDAASKAIADLNNLGFNYRLVEENTTARAATPTASRGRRSGVADEVLSVVKASKDGLNRAAVLEQMSATDTKTQQSISNALANLKKKGLLNHADDGTYTAA